MTKKVQFTFPISSTKEWKGQLHVSAEVDGQEAVIHQVILQDKSGRRCNITELVDEWCLKLYSSLCDAAVHNADTSDEDTYTLEKQDWA